MELALLADIHGNYLALEAVLKEVRTANISNLLISGDFMGYYYNPHKVLDLLSEFNVIACRGNHEELFEKWLIGSQDVKDQLIQKYGRGFKIAESILTQEQKAWYGRLPHPASCEFDGKKICICHGSPWDLDLYLYEDTLDNYENNFKPLQDKYDIIILGHSHYQFVKKMENLIIINPGSVGQPRSGETISTPEKIVRAQWATLNTKDLSVQLYTTMYDASLLFEEIDKYDPLSSYLKKVLLRRS